MEVAKNSADTLSALRQAVAEKLGKQRFELWFGAECSFELCDRTLTVGLPNPLFQRWISKQFRHEILTACEEVLGYCPELDFRLISPPMNGACGRTKNLRHSRNHSAVPVFEEFVVGLPETSKALAACPTGAILERGNAEEVSVQAAAEELPQQETAEVASFAPESGGNRTAERLSAEANLGIHTGSLVPKRPNGKLVPHSKECSEILGEMAEREQTSSTNSPLATLDIRPESGQFSDRGAKSPASSLGESISRRAGEAAPIEQNGNSVSSNPASTTWRVFRASRFFRLDHFVVGPGSQLAYAMAQEVVRRPGQYSPLVLYGPTSVGKTHLLEAICLEVRKQHPGINALYIWAEAFTTAFLEALRGGGLPSFRQKYRKLDVLAVDDLQFFRGKDCTIRELMSTIEVLLAQGKQVILASDKPLEQIPQFREQFLARLGSGMVCRLDPPDYATRLALVAELSARMTFPLSHEVQQFIASRITGHARELCGAIRRLQACAHLWQRPVDLALAESALKELINTASRPAKLSDIRRAICETFDLEPEKLVESSRSVAVTQPRILAMWLARKYSRAALSEISRFFGRRSHSTVLSAQKTVERWLAEGKTFQLAGGEMPVEEVIRQLEYRLKAG